MSGKIGGYLIIGAAVFGLGVGCAPDKVVTKTHTEVVTVRTPVIQKVYVTDTKVVTKVVQSASCKEAKALNDKLFEINHQILSNFGGVPDSISAARLAIYNKDLPATTRAVQPILDARDKGNQLVYSYREVESQAELAIDKCNQGK